MEKAPKTGVSQEVRMEGLEPPRLAAPDPKSGTATNYATCACELKNALFYQKGAQI